MTIRVGMDARHAARGLGLSTFVTNLSRALAERGEFEIVWLGSAEAAPDGLEAHAVAGPYPRLDVLDADRIARRHNLDAMVFGGNSGPPKPLSVPVVLTVHDLLFFEESRPSQLRPLIGHFYERWNVPRALKAASVVATGSQVAAEELADLVPGIEATVVWHGITSRAATGTPVVADAVVAFTGRDQRKRSDLVLDAYERLDSPRPPLVLFASAGLPSALEPQLDRLQHENEVHVCGHLPRADVDATLAASLALVYSSEREGFGLPVIEGMAAGAPVITGLAPSTREISGDVALIIDQDESAASIAASIEQLRTDEGLHARLQDRGRAHAAGFTWEKAASEYAQLLHRALDGTS